MKNIVIEVLPNRELRYPNGHDVSQGDTVTFRIEGIIGDVHISFDDTSCFTSSGPWDVNSSSLSALNSVFEVSSTAPRDEYPFTVTTPGGSSKDKDKHVGPGNHETKRGTIDVTTDPPKDKTK
ncbi:hypothetical protein [Pyxidicoccus xibeiensis]|uniref:hypothetical protein n=1 Tax=Pyxidicoccus xibeiensis TaxID=2906759 RepID=UPI0020A81A45|nr:hypothetical protein [Pyxidicoccus xibeiensis]MCP3140771.1 hypothetical protein [Pyxidicoccus xibeiensis]